MIARDTVRAGETIVSLAARLTGNGGNWGAIVRLNKLKAPYITEAPRRGTLSPGEEVLYPAPTMPATPPDRAQLAAETYKRDLRAEGGDLVLGGGGNLVTDVGLDNLRAALTRRLSTLIGRHPWHPLYGSLLPGHIGKVADPFRLRLICVDARRAVLRDPRVESCTVAAVWEADVLRVDCAVTPIPPGTPFEVSWRYRP